MAMKPRPGLTGMLALILAAAIVAGCAETRLAEVRRVTRTEATENCVGDPRTPLCALETFFACSVRRDLSLCPRVGVTDFGFGDYPRPPVVPTHKEYILLKEYTIREGDKLPVDKTMPADWEPDWYKPGFVEFELIIRTCYTDGRCHPRGHWESYRAYVKPVDGVWYMASWAGGSDQEGEDEPPEEE